MSKSLSAMTQIQIAHQLLETFEDVLGKMSEDDLWELRELIDSCLPSAELAQMNLTKENHLSHIQSDINKININLAEINTTLKIKMKD